MTDYPTNQPTNTREALMLLLDQVDYTARNCKPNEPVGGVLSVQVIKICREVLRKYGKVEQTTLSEFLKNA